jgi:hypothetical protein
MLDALWNNGCMYDAYVKNGSARKVKFLNVKVPHRENMCRTVDKLKQTGSLLDIKT